MFDTRRSVQDHAWRRRETAGGDDVNTRSSSHSPRSQNALQPSVLMCFPGVPNYMVTHIGVQFIWKHSISLVEFKLGDFLELRNDSKNFRI
jgi:hypothetical protein